MPRIPENNKHRPGYKYIFGPVPSRRLGRSLGVDLVPFKTCTYDCIYCQLGKTTNKTIERKNYVNHEQVIQEIRHILNKSPGIDYFTLAGSGEPTLNNSIQEVIAQIKTITPIPVAVLTNGSLLFQEQVQKALARADVVLPTVVSADDNRYQKIHRPHPNLDYNQVMAGMARFRKIYRGKIWLEVFLVAGLNDSDRQVENVARMAAEIKPDRIQLNTAERLTTEDYSRSVSQARLSELTSLFSPPAEIIASCSPAEETPQQQPNEEDVLAMLMRRPMTTDDLALALKTGKEQIEAFTQKLVNEKKIKQRSWQGKTFFSISS